MKVKLTSGDRIRIPEGCKATINGNEVVIEKKEQEFKDGDVIIDRNAIVILKGDFNDGRFSSYASINYDELNICTDKWDVNGPDWRLATEEEKQFLFDKMKEIGYQWNADEKQVEKILWRSYDGNAYFLINRYGEVLMYHENNCSEDKRLYNIGNYFRTIEEAEKAAEAVKETLMKFHEENE